MEKALEPFLQSIAPELLLQLGRELEGSGLSGAPSPPDAMIEHARRWIGAHVSAIRLAICPHFEKIYPILQQDPANAVTAIADLLAGLWVGVSPFTVGKICVQVGLKHICVNARVPE